MATLLPNAKQYFVDANGAPLASGKVYFYVPNTSTPKDTWQDADEQTLNTNPVILDANGEAIIYGNGSYRQLVTDADDNVIWDQETAGTGLSASGVTAGSYTNTDLTVDANGIITAASNGSAGGGSAHGQCFMEFTNSSTVTLLPWNGNSLVINSNAEVVPSAGITLAATGLTPATRYYIYAYMDSGTMTLEADTTEPAQQSTTGVFIKTGDATRTLVGMVYPITGPSFADDPAQRFTRSWFNEGGISGSNYLASNKTTSSTFYVEIDSAERVEFMLWQDERVHITANLQVMIASGTGNVESMIGVNDTTGTGTINKRKGVITFAAFGYNGYSSDISLTFSTPTDSYNYATILGKVDSGTGTWFGVNNNCGISYMTTRNRT